VRAAEHDEVAAAGPEKLLGEPLRSQVLVARGGVRAQVAQEDNALDGRPVERGDRTLERAEVRVDIRVRRLGPERAGEVYGDLGVPEGGWEVVAAPERADLVGERGQSAPEGGPDLAARARDRDGPGAKRHATTGSSESVRIPTCACSGTSSRTSRPPDQ
jgi:hypothetical protein